MTTLYDLPEGSGRRFLFGLFGRDHDEEKCEKDGCGDCAIIVQFDSAMQEKDRQIHQLRGTLEETEAVKTSAEALLVKAIRREDELASLLDASHPRIGRPRHCGREGCRVCVLLERYGREKVITREENPCKHDWTPINLSPGFDSQCKKCGLKADHGT